MNNPQLRRIFPTPLKRAARSVVGALSRFADDRRLKRACASLKEGNGDRREVLTALRRAWGNESFSADVAYLTESARRVEAQRLPILECGSGVTTLVAGALSPVPVLSLEQDAEWAEFVRRRLDLCGIRGVTVLHAPLARYGDYVWYDLNGVTLPPRFGFVMCDGPAVFESEGDCYPAWRYGVLPALGERGVRVDEILLDDATEPRAPRLLERWEKEFGMRHVLLRSAEGDCAVVRRV
jgi:hypothetical protein